MTEAGQGETLEECAVWWLCRGKVASGAEEVPLGMAGGRVLLSPSCGLWTLSFWPPGAEGRWGLIYFQGNPRRCQRMTGEEGVGVGRRPARAAGTLLQTRSYVWEERGGGSECGNATGPAWLNGFLILVVNCTPALSRAILPSPLEVQTHSRPCIA